MSLRLMFCACYFVALVSLIGAVGEGQEANEVCFPIQKGPPGPQGIQGIPGECNCNGSDVRSLEKAINIQSETLQMLSRRIENLEREREEMELAEGEKNLSSVVLINSKVEEIVKQELRKRNNCPVGLRDGRIADADITASSTYNATTMAENNAPFLARLDNQPRGQTIGAWRSKNVNPIQRISCNTVASSYSQMRFMVNCPKNCHQRSYSSYNIYGSGTYTSNSQICRAAIHDGKLTAEGGIVTVQMKPRRIFPSSRRHNIRSQLYTAQQGSFMFAPINGLQWIQVDFHTPTLVTGVITQGRPTAREEWLKSYMISYGNSEDDLTIMAANNGTDLVFQANTDRTSQVKNMFLNPITARYVRLMVLTWHNHISLRLEYLTC